MKLFEEIARSLRLVKGVHQPEVFEPETPASAPVFEIIVPSDAAAQQAGCSPELRDTIRVIRRDVLATLRQVPAFPHGQFVENVDLIRLPPDIAGAIAGIAIQAALAEISAKLDVVATAVDNLAELVRVANLGALQGAIDALEIARQLRDADRRRKQMLDACNEVVVQLGVIAGQMAAHVKEMPSENTGFWNGWNGDGIAMAEKAYVRVCDDFTVLLEGLRRTVAAYVELGEFGAAVKAFSLVCDRIDASPRLAANRARLLPYSSEEKRPERLFEDFLIGKAAAEARLQTLAGGVRPALALVFDRAELVGEG